MSGVDIHNEDEVELAKKVKKETGLEWDKLGNHSYFKFELDNLRKKAVNQKATDNIKGESSSGSQAKEPKDYLDGRELPEKTPANRRLRANIAREMVKKEGKGAIKFYND